MFEVHISGFKTLEAARQFARWYSGQGEQMIDAWWDARKDEGADIGSQPMAGDILVCESEGKVALTIEN